ncbi:MAG TPA: hypothetical protein VGF95_07630 [Solirubrobacteraceae bacterium]|jgi:hypothetical protein
MRVTAQGAARIVATLLATLVACALLSAPALAAEGEGCPNEQLRAESNVNAQTGRPFSTELPECRAYEMVSPLDKQGYSISGPPEYVSASAAGGAVTYESLGSFSEPLGYESRNTYAAVRTSSGWVTHATAVPASLLPFAVNLNSIFYAPDLSEELTCGTQSESRATEESQTAGFICALRGPSGAWSAATPAYPPQRGGKSKVIPVETIGASQGLADVVFNLAGDVRLLPNDTAVQPAEFPSELTGLYEITGIGTGEAALHLVNVDNNGEQIGTLSPKLGNSWGEGISRGRSYHAISADGSTIFFEATPSGGVQTLYARIDAAHTVSISEPSVADCGECQTGASLQRPAEFQGASADGTKVFFTTEQELLPGRSGRNLYEYDFDAPAGERVILVSRGAPDAAVQGVLSSSADGSHAYFVAQGLLTTTANAAGEKAAAGADNLYAFEQDEAYPGGRVQFVAQLCSGPQASGSTADALCPGSASSDGELWQVEQFGSGREETTPNGTYLIFDTYAHLLPEDGNEALAIYRYDAQTGELAWISHAVPGSNEPDAGLSAVLPESTVGDDAMGALPDVDDRGRAISEDGSEIVFSTDEALSSQDVNGGVDAYLWHNGIVSLISDGAAPESTEVSFVEVGQPAISGTGEDIYFITTGQLVGQDTDDRADMYDARVDGGFPHPVQVECAAEEAGAGRGEACQGTPSPAQAFLAPASTSFSGGTNLTPPSETKPGASKTQTRPKRRGLTPAQRRAKALRACRGHAASKRRACERRVRRKQKSRVKTKAKTGRAR